MSRILWHVFNLGIVHIEIPNILHVFTHVNIVWFGCMIIVVHIAVCIGTGAAIYTSGLQRTTARVLPPNHQVSSVVPVGKDKSISGCI